MANDPILPPPVPPVPSAILLDETPRALLVEAGEALFFRVDAEADGRPGPRRFLTTVAAGTTVCHPGQPGFLLVPGPGCRLRERSLDEVPASEVDAWIGRLCLLLAEELPLGPPQALAADTPYPVETVVTGQPGRVMWVRLKAGQLAPLGSAGHALDASAAAFPITENLWLTVTQPLLEWTMQPTEAVPPRERLAGLRSLVRLVLAWSRDQEQRYQAQLDRRSVRRQDDLERETAEAVGRLVQVIEPQAFTLPPGDHLMTALLAVGHAQGITFRPAPENSPGDPVEAIARASRVRFRRLHLSGPWWTQDLGTFLGFVQEGEGENQSLRPVALLRRGSAYEILDPQTRRGTPLTAALGARIIPRGYQFFPPFPARTLSLWELPPFALRLHLPEIFSIGLLALFATLLGVVLPLLTARIIDLALPQGDVSLLVQFGLLLIAAYAGQALFSLTQGYLSQRFYTGSTIKLQAATWDRLLHLGLGFFQRFSSGEMLKRAMLVTEVSQTINATMLRSALSGSLSLLYLFVMFSYSVTLAWVALLLGVLTTAVTVTLALMIRRHALPLTLLEGKNFGFVVQLINGVAKLRIAGAEQRGFNRWASRYEQQLRHTARIRFLTDVDHVLLFVLPLLGSLVLYALTVPIMVNPGGVPAALTLGGLIAFFTTYAMFSEGLNAIGGTIVDVTDVLARQVLLRPILETEPESLQNRSDPGVLQGQVTVDHVSFRYSPTGPLVLDRVSLDARPGEFIAIVGPSGSGKSTLVRLLLGFDPPATGQILYDGQNLTGLDVQAVRKQIGTVLQSSYLFAGPLFENIAAGNLVGVEEVHAAVQEAGLAEDVQAMPMGLHTLIAEGGRNLSGGQRQRVLLARALVTMPRILILDEATSALDNRTQALVTENLARRRVTRIVIAHRLSTIQKADRIYVLDQGRLIQQGTFAELMAQDGLFRRLMERQQA